MECGNCIFIGGKTFVVTYQKENFFSNDSHNLALYLKNGPKTKNIFLYFASCIYKNLCNKYSWGNSISWSKIQQDVIQLPVTSTGEIDFDFMNDFIAELEAERTAELEAYLQVTGLSDYVLTDEEEKALEDYKTLEWERFNLKSLFGASTRGKRLKSADRNEGDLAFVTAGEAFEGISAYISNSVEVFSANTTTIDMFGSAKYRNYKYGADDHVAVVHTEKLPKYASIFVTSAIHKAAHTGKFSYSKNFYAKDADELDISLPTKNGQPDYSTMDVLISAVQKLVIKDVVKYAGDKIKNTAQVISNNK